MSPPIHIIQSTITKGYGIISIFSGRFLPIPFSGDAPHFKDIRKIGIEQKIQDQLHWLATKIINSYMLMTDASPNEKCERNISG